MKKLIVLAAFGLAASSACASGTEAPDALTTPAPSYAPGGAPAYQNGGILGPAGKARDTADQLDQHQQQQEGRTGGGALVPEADPGDF